MSTLHARMYIFLVCALYVYVHTSESYSIKPGVRVSHCHTVSSGYAGTSSWIHPQGCHQGPSGKGDCPVPFCGRPHSTPPLQSLSQTEVLAVQPLLPWLSALLHEKIAAPSATL